MPDLYYPYSGRSTDMVKFKENPPAIHCWRSKVNTKCIEKVFHERTCEYVEAPTPTKGESPRSLFVFEAEILKYMGG